MTGTALDGPTATSKDEHVDRGTTSTRPSES